jgi:hypothetical protein
MRRRFDQALALVRRHRPAVGVFDMQLRANERGSDIADQLSDSGDPGEMAILYVTGEAEAFSRRLENGGGSRDRNMGFWPRSSPRLRASSAS